MNADLLNERIKEIQDKIKELLFVDDEQAEKLQVKLDKLLYKKHLQGLKNG